MSKTLALLVLVSSARIGLAQTDAEFKRSVIDALPSRTSLIGFARVRSNAALVVTSQSEEGYSELTIRTCLATFASGKAKLSKAIEGESGVGRPHVTKVDVDQDGVPEIAVVCNRGGAHGITDISVAKATASGVIDLARDTDDAYDWTVIPGRRGKPATLVAESSTYLYTGVHGVGGVGGRPLFIQYTYRDGRFLQVKTNQILRLDAIERRANGSKHN